MSFTEAQSIFYDEFAIQFDDDSAIDEARFIMLELSSFSRVLVVVHCEQGDDSDVIRIISARKATSKERQHYQGDST